MTENDILLSVGLDLSSLQKAQHTVAQTVSAWNFPQAGIIKPGQTTLVDQYGKALSSVTSNLKESADAAKGASAAHQLLGTDLAHLLQRISVWSIAWTVAYGTLRQGVKEVMNLGESMAALNDAILSVRGSTEELGETFDTKFSLIKERIIAVTAAGIVPMKDMAAAFKVLSFEGLNTAQALSALENVRQLSTITGDKATRVAESLAEVYGLFKDVVKKTGTEEEKLNYITNLMTGAYSKAGVSVSDFHKTIAKVGVAAKELGVDLEYLSKLMIWLDANMVSGRLSSAQLRESLLEVMGDASKLNKAFGTTISDLDTYFVRIERLQKALKQLSVSELRQKAIKLFPDINQAETFIKLLREEVTLSNVSALNEAAILETQKKRAHELASAANTMRTGVMGWLKGVGDWFKRLGDAQYLKDLEKAKKLFESPEQLGTAEAVSDYQREYLQMIYEEYKAKQLALEEAKRFREEEARTNEERKASVEAALKASKELRAEQIKINEDGRKQLAILLQEARISQLEAAGVDKRYVSQQKITNLILSTSDRIVDAQQRVAVREALRAASAQEISLAYKTATVALGDQASALEFMNKLQAERVAMMQEDVREMISLADEFQGLTTDFVKNMLSGTVDVNKFLKDIMASYKSALAEELVKTFGESTGIFASMASSFMSPLQKAHYTGIKDAVPLIVQAHIDGITQGMSGVSSGGGAQTATGGANLLQNIQSLFGGAGGAPTQYAEVGGMGKVPVKPTTMQTLGKMTGQALSVASFASEMASAYKAKGSGNPWGTGISLGTSGAIAGAAVGGPIGAVIGAAVGATYGFIRGAQSKTTSESSQQIIETNSILRLSHKELQIISRDMSGLRRGMEGFILTRSAYFSEGREGTSERFNLDSRRGLL